MCCRLSFCSLNFRVMLLPIQIREDFQALARLAAALTDAHSSAVFLPTELLVRSHSLTSPARSGLKAATNTARTKGLHSAIFDNEGDRRVSSIDLVAVQSYAKLARDCRIQVGSGLLGWVADQGRPIHLTPFDVGPSALGVYIDNEPIKSLVAVPIQIPHQEGSHAETCHGVLMCDSLKPDGFSNLHVKLLEQLAALASRLIFWGRSSSDDTRIETSWDFFCRKTNELGEAIGAASIEVLRIRVESFNEAAHAFGISSAVQSTEQFVRLAQQALPPHFPLAKLPNGDIVIALDNMMGSFFEQKLRSLAQHLGSSSKPFSITLDSFGARVGAHGRCDMDATLQQQPIIKKTSSTSGGTRA
jgi:hypothetical protein